jgi:hypothetical protein
MWRSWVLVFQVQNRSKTWPTSCCSLLMLVLKDTDIVNMRRYRGTLHSRQEKASQPAHEGCPSSCITVPVSMWPALSRTHCAPFARQCWTIFHAALTCHCMTYMSLPPPPPPGKWQRAVDLGQVAQWFQQNPREVSLWTGTFSWYVNGMPASVPAGTVLNSFYSYAQNNPQTGFSWTNLIYVLCVMFLMCFLYVC